MRLAEGFRAVPVRLAAGHRDYRTAIVGLDRQGVLRRLFDDRLRRVAIPAEGLVLTDRLAERLGVRPGDAITVAVLEGERPVREVVLAATVAEMIGLNAYMDAKALHRLLREGDVVSGVAVAVDPAMADTLYARLKTFPRVATVAVKAAALDSFRRTTMSFVLVFTGILTAFAVVIAIGVVYNNARIALAERAWELASLRVLGFTRGEVAGMLFAELAHRAGAGASPGAVAWARVRRLAGRDQCDGAVQHPAGDRAALVRDRRADRRGGGDGECLDRAAPHRSS